MLSIRNRDFYFKIEIYPAVIANIIRHITTAHTNVMSPTTFAGTFKWLQVVEWVDFSETTLPNPLTPSQTITHHLSRLDNGFPLPGTGTTDASTDLTDTFAKGIALDSYATDSEEYSLYLMFKPNFSNSVWVPLRKLV